MRPFVCRSLPALTAASRTPKFPVPDGRMAAFRLRAEGGKSGLHGGTVPGNARRGRPQGKCHRKYTAAASRTTGRAARVKRCGKSAPRRRRRRRQGKPHREQDQVGAAGIPVRGNAGRTSAPPLGSVARGARQRASQRNGHPRLQDQLLGAGQNPAYTPSGALFQNIPRTHAGSKKNFMVLFRKAIDAHLVP